MVLNLCVILYALFILHVHAREQEDEPQCLSRFDHDFKVIQMLLNLEQEQKELRETITKQQNIIDILQKKGQGAGSTYIRWGRTSCSDNEATLTYAGYMAGSKHSEHGGGANYLCLTDQPLWGYYDESVESLGKLVGIEYQFWNHRTDGAGKYFGSNLYNHDAPCAVCHIPRGASIMVPGRNECFEGWTKEYNGYLVSGYPGFKHSTEFVCLDKRPETILKSGGDDEESMVYMVEGVCGKSLPCPPYVAGRELTCVVCSK